MTKTDKPSTLRISKTHDENNLRTAREILAEPARWGGEEAGLVRWARGVVERLEGEKAAWRRGRRKRDGNPM